MPGWDSYSQAVRADGPIAWYRFQELNPGQAVAAGGQNPQNLCFDSSFNGNANMIAGTPTPNPNQFNIPYGVNVLSNQPSLLNTNASGVGVNSGDAGGTAQFPDVPAKVVGNIITSATTRSPLLEQPTISIESWLLSYTISASAKQVLACYGSDASSLAAYNLYHTGSSAVNHTAIFAVNVGGVEKVATAPLANGALVTGTVYHFCGTYDGSNVSIYVNGVLQTQTSAPGTIGYGNLGNQGLAMGNDPSLTRSNIRGSLGEVAIYGYALSPARVAYHYRQGSMYLPFVWNH